MLYASVVGTMLVAIGSRLSARGQPPGGTHLLIISGAGGEPQYREAFHAMGARLAEAAVRRLGLPDSSVIFLAEDSTRAPARGRSSRGGVERALDALAGRMRGNDRLVVVLIGHGSHQGNASRFNLPGPDVGAAEFARLLDRFGARTVAVVNTASASGEWVAALSARNRVVITATKSGFEGNATLFPRYFVEALAGDGADADKSGSVSLAEAYDFARREVARAYEQDGRLLTEHAQLDDDGDGRGTAEPPRAGAGDGALARRVVLRTSPALASARGGDPRAAALYAERDSLQQAVEALRARKDRTAAATYERELERLLVALATTNRAIREREGRTP
ncbi:MAG TPA: hypothetical protein VNA89_13290 [Gemmatimonadaceae bacterium]|nr:hypothetical protein [Gemmatimonadaceae bacterium]